MLIVELTACGRGSNSYSGSPFSSQNDVIYVQSGDGTKQVALRKVNELPPPPNTSGGLDQLIAENDLLDIKIFDVKQLDQDVEVDSRGNISLPLVGQVRAAGKSAHQLVSDLKKLYGAKYLQNPQITVRVKESFKQRVTIDGEIRTAGLLRVVSGSTLMRVIAESGGFTEVADPRKVFVFRDASNEKLVAQFNVFDIRAAKKSDPHIYAGDVIVVFSSNTRVAMKNLRESLALAVSFAALART
jgi:polysaccharide export outer membrane protein